MKTFRKFQLDCNESLHGVEVNEGILDNLRKFGASTVRGGISSLASRASRVPGEIQKRLPKPQLGNQSRPIPNTGGGVSGFASRVPGEIQKRLPKPQLGNQSRPISKKPDITGSTRDSSNMNTFDKIRGGLGAAREALPALAGGALGINRTDRNISPDMEKEIKSAHSRALSRGSKDIDYKDYADTPAGFAAAKTMGRIGDKDWKRDKTGKITGFRQKYDTNQTPQQLTKDLGNAIKNKNFSQILYKPAEIALSAVQNRGLTTHDIDFNKDKPKYNAQSLSRSVYNQPARNAYATATAPVRAVRDFGRNLISPNSTANNTTSKPPVPSIPSKPPVSSTTTTSSFAGARDAAVAKARKIQGSPVVGPRLS